MDDIDITTAEGYMPQNKRVELVYETSIPGVLSTIRGCQVVIRKAPLQDLNLDVEKQLDKLSMFGGNTSSRREEYSMWQFDTNGVNYAKAIVLLRTSGWQANRR